MDYPYPKGFLNRNGVILFASFCRIFITGFRFQQRMPHVIFRFAQFRSLDNEGRDLLSLLLGTFDQIFESGGIGIMRVCIIAVIHVIGHIAGILDFPANCSNVSSSS